MRLADGSTRLTVVLRYTNLGEEPVPLWVRWHPYLVLDDPYGEHSVIVAPGPGPGQMRRIRVGMGRDTHFLDVPGYWMAINGRTGNGVWMTFREEEVQVCAAWTDYRRAKHPKRGWFTVEPRRKKRLLAPGERVEMHLTYQPFAPGDRLDPGFVAPEERSAALRWARLVRENAAVIAAHTMVPWPNEGRSAAGQNRFYFNNLRRDRFGLADAGIADALMAVPGVQSIPLRMRHYARLFDNCYDRTEVRCRLTVTDVLGRTALREAWTYEINPMETRTLDRRAELGLEGLEDGRYTFRLDVDLGEAQGLHSYEEERVLAGRARARAAEARRGAGSLVERERPFVRALREVEIPADGRVPIGVEEAAGKTRVDWPMRVGVPFAEGALPPGAGISLSDALGRRLDTQAKVMGTWPDGSARWLLVDFQSDVVGGEHGFLSLDRSGGPGQQGPDMAGSRGDGIAVDVGTRVWVLAADGRIEGLLQPGDLWWKTGEGRTYRFRVSGPGAGVRIVENGPLRCRVRVTGWYHPEKGKGPRWRGGSWTPSSTAAAPSSVSTTPGPTRGTRGRTPSAAPGSSSAPRGPSGRRRPSTSTGRRSPATAWWVVRQIDDEHVEAVTSRLSLRGSRSTGTARLRRKERDLVIHHRDFWRLFPKRRRGLGGGGDGDLPLLAGGAGGHGLAPAGGRHADLEQRPHLGPGGRGLPHPRVHRRCGGLVRAARVRGGLRRARGLRRAAAVPDGHRGPDAPAALRPGGLPRSGSPGGRGPGELPAQPAGLPLVRPVGLGLPAGRLRGGPGTLGEPRPLRPPAERAERLPRPLARLPALRGPPLAPSWPRPTPATCWRWAPSATIPGTPRRAA